MTEHTAQYTAPEGNPDAICSACGHVATWHKAFSSSAKGCAGDAGQCPCIIREGTIALANVRAFYANAPRIAAEHAELVQALREIERLCLAASAGYGDDPDTDVAIIARNAHAALSKVEAE